MKKDDLTHRFLMMLFPLMLQNIVTISVNLADNMMLGAYGEASLSGVAAVNQIQFVYQQILMALGDGVVMFASQYWGKRDTASIRPVASCGLCSAMGVAAVLFLLVSLLPGQLLGLFTTDAAISAEGMAYLRIIRFSYGFFALTILMLAMLRSVEIVKIAFRLSLMTLVVNCGINYVLIYGRFGAPEMGVAGAAVGTLTARVLECLAVLWYVLRKQRVIPVSFRELFRPRRELLGRYWKKTMPMVLISASWGLNVAMQTMILGHMTSAAIAANSAASTLFLMAKSAAVGASGTAAALIGKTIGTGDADLVRRYSKKMQRIFVVIGLLSAIFLFLIRIPVLRVYQLSEEAAALADAFLLILCVVCAGMSYQMPTNSGIIKGGGDVGFVVKMDFISIWCIVVPISLIMAFLVQAPPVVVVCCLNADQVFKCIPAFLHSHYGDWIKKLA